MAGRAVVRGPLILVDSSAWIEYFRATGGSADAALTSLVQEDGPVITTEPVFMELLAGVRYRRDRGRVSRTLSQFPLLPVRSLEDWEQAAGIYRSCRRGGVTPRAMGDCLIAAVAIRAGAVLLHRDRDFEAIARHAPLEVYAQS